MSDNKTVKATLEAIDSSEAVVENILFNNRLLVVLFAFVMTAFLAFQALQLRPDASFEKMIPASHEYVQNFFTYRDDLKGLGNAVRISVETTDADIFTAEFMDHLRKVHDEVFFLNGVDRSALMSLWAAGARWSEVTEEGFSGGPIVPDSYDGSPASLESLRQNLLKSGKVGSLVANNFNSALIYAPLYDKDPQTGESLDYQKFSEDLETLVREKYQTENIKIHITGFAKVVGDLINGASQIILFFAGACLITLILLYLYSRCITSTLIALFCSIVAVIWQLGLLHTMGFGLDPYSMLVPFLVFAIGVSHGVQIINGISHMSMAGHNKLEAAKRTFRMLYIPGIIALISDGVGFSTLMVIDIKVIQDLAVAASVGVAVVIFTNLILLPVLISYVGVSKKATQSLQHEENDEEHPIWHFLASFSRPKMAAIALLTAVVGYGLGFYNSQDLKVGDLDPGAPELRADSRYNLDNAFMGANYSASSDVFVVMVKSTELQTCASYETVEQMDRLQWRLQNVAGVQSTQSLASISKSLLSGMNEGSLKWMALSRNQGMMDAASIRVQEMGGLINGDCDLAPMLVFLDDHKAETLQRVVGVVKQFAADNSNDAYQFLLAAGNAGIEAATNEVIGSAQYEILIWVYAAVSFLCLLSFRSVTATICIILPLTLTSVLCQALMTYLGIGIKVATLPVIALGVGIGVDYGIYIFSKLDGYLKAGDNLHDAYFKTLQSTGKAVAFTGATLAIGVATWALSPIKFQADMGILLTFMFVWNMLGALILLPALACFLHKPKKPAAEIEAKVEAKA
ncbi:MAG: MMPL family transporter [Amphritea sp.]